MSKRLQRSIRTPQDIAVITVEKYESQFGIFVKATTLVIVEDTGQAFILMENGTAVDSLDTTAKVSLGEPDVNAPGWVKSFVPESRGDIPEYNTDSAINPEIKPSGHTSQDIQDLKDKQADTGNDLNDHLTDYTNPHQVTKTQVGLDQVDNTSDLDKPVSNATQLALDDKADLPGNATQIFKVGRAIEGDDAARLEQVNEILDGALSFQGYWPIDINSYPDETLSFDQKGYFWECNADERYDKDGRLWYYGEWIHYNGGDPVLGTSWDKLRSQSGDDTFIGHTDTPASYVGFGGKRLQVDASEDKLIFVDAPPVTAPSPYSLSLTPTFVEMDNILTFMIQISNTVRFAGIDITSNPPTRMPFDIVNVAGLQTYLDYSKAVNTELVLKLNGYTSPTVPADYSVVSATGDVPSKTEIQDHYDFQIAINDAIIATGLLQPIASVLSVNTRTGHVTLDKTDVGIIEQTMPVPQLTSSVTPTLTEFTDMINRVNQVVTDLKTAGIYV